ncbi:MAG: riboflavin biosynthesis protein RibF [Firmicutes bacterium]|nr:riboflavin biosynthesis protein RibF [Bacillota bacterium]
MKIIDLPNSRGIKKPLYLALGNFDGVHRGHQAVIGTAVRLARGDGGSAAALLFDPHPSVLLRPQKHFCLLTGIEERAALLEQLGLDCIFVVPFDARTAALPPEDFVRQVLLEQLQVSGVSIGFDYSFGCGGTGKEEQMQAYGRKMGFTVAVSPLERDSGGIISSSAVKKVLAEGAVKQVARLLNYYFFRRGEVVSGRGRGKKVLYPTANLKPDPGLAWPGGGVYLTAVGGLDGPIHFGLTNVGVKPTFGDDLLTVETYILDFTGELYGRSITLYFLERLRDTLNFASPALLREQIDLDITRGRELARTCYGSIDAFVEPVHFIRPSKELFYICD